MKKLHKCGSFDLYGYFDLYIKFVFRFPHCRCDFPAEISAQKISAENTDPGALDVQLPQNEAERKEVY
jgi:hypothetical protein